MEFFIFISLFTPSLALILIRKRGGPIENPARLGFVAGMLPIFVSSLWAIYFILRYKGGYSFDEMQVMDAFTLMHYPLVPLLVPLFSNWVWRRSDAPLGWKRFFQFLTFVLNSALVMSMPLSWNFTFLLFPFSLIVLLIGFCFPIRRKKPGFEPELDSPKEFTSDPPRKG